MNWIFYIVKFFEFAPLYIILVVIPAIIRNIIDVKVIEITPVTFKLPPKESPLFSKFEDSYESAVLTVCYFPFFEELVFRACPLFLLGLPGLVLGNVVWALMHPAWQLRYLSSLKTKQKILFTLNALFYYACCAIFYSLPWLQQVGLIAIAYHMLHNGMITFGEVLSDVELPLPWKKEEEQEFLEENDEDEEDMLVDLSGSEEEEEDLGSIEDLKFYRVAEKPKITAKSTAKVDDDWFFWIR